VQCGEGCRGIWECSAVKERKEIVTYFLTMCKHGNKVGFGVQERLLEVQREAPYDKEENIPKWFLLQGWIFVDE